MKEKRIKAEDKGCKGSNINNKMRMMIWCCCKDSIR